MIKDMLVRWLIHAVINIQVLWVVRVQKTLSQTCTMYIRECT